MERKQEERERGKIIEDNTREKPIKKETPGKLTSRQKDLLHLCARFEKC